MLERLENGDMRKGDTGALDDSVATVKMGEADNQAYAGIPQSDDPDVLEKDGDQVVAERVAPMLVSHLQGRWNAAVDDKYANGIDEDLLACLRQFKGQYSSEEEARLNQRGMPTVYFPLSEHKVHTAIAWIDEFFTNGETLVNIRPTPLPEMESDVVKQTMVQSMQDVAAVVQQTGMMPPPEMLSKYAALMRQLVEQNVDVIAKEKALKMERKIRDDLVQGRWSESIHELVGYCCTYGTAAFRCPVIRLEYKLAWENGKPVRKERIVRSFEAISPFDVFPSPGAKDSHSGDFIVRVRYSAHDLQAMREAPSWRKDAIDESLATYGSTGIRLEVGSDSQRRLLENQRSSTYDNGVMEGFEYWGGASGLMLSEIGVTKDAHGDTISATAHDWYQINAIVIGSQIVYCRVMDKGEDRPVDVVKFYDTPGQFWGRGVLQIIRNLQRICNAAGRSLVTNMGFASGPQGIVDLNAIDSRDDLKLRPFKIWVTRKNASTMGGKAVEFFNVDSHARELMEVFDYHQRLADELTGIPAYANGTDAATGAARTATGLNLLMGQANRGVKKVIGNFDELVRHSVNRLVEWHVLHDDDPSIVGDIFVEVTGLRYFVTKTSRANDILNLVDRITQNPNLAQLPGVERLCDLLHEVGIAMDLGAYSLAPSSDELRRRQEEARQQMMQQQQAQEAAVQAEQNAQVDAAARIEQAKAAVQQQANAAPQTNGGAQ